MKNRIELDNTLPENKFPRVENSNPSKTIAIDDLEDKQKDTVLTILSELINLSSHHFQFTTNSVATQSGLEVHFDSGYFGQSLDLLNNLVKLNLLIYSEKVFPPHETDEYVNQELSITSDLDRANYVSECLCYKIITQINYQAIVELHKSWLNTSHKIVGILLDHFALICKFKAKAFGVELIIDNNDFAFSPIYIHMILPAMQQICTTSQLALYSTAHSLEHRKIYHNNINWEEFAKLVKQAKIDSNQKFEAYKLEQLHEKNIRIKPLAQALGIFEEAISIIKVHDNNDLTITFSNAYQQQDFLQTICLDLKTQNIVTNKQTGMITIPFNARSQFQKLIDNSYFFSIIINLNYSFIKDAFKIKTNDLKVDRDLQYIYLLTDLNSQISIYRLLKENYFDCALQEKGVIRLPAKDIDELKLFINLYLEEKPCKYDFCKYLGVASPQVKIHKAHYIISFSTEAACHSFQKKFKRIPYSENESSKSIKILYSRDLKLFLEEQKFLLEEEKLETYFMNHYAKANSLKEDLLTFENAPYNIDWLKQKFGDQLINAKLDYLWINFSLKKDSMFYAKTIEFFKKLNCGKVPFMDDNFALMSKAKWHIICAIECALGNDIDFIKLFNFNNDIEKTIQAYVDNNQKLLEESQKNSQTSVVSVTQPASLPTLFTSKPISKAKVNEDKSLIFKN